MYSIGVSLVYLTVVIACTGSLATLFPHIVVVTQPMLGFPFNALCAEASVVNADIEPVALIDFVLNPRHILSALKQVLAPVTLPILSAEKAVRPNRTCCDYNMHVRIVHHRVLLILSLVDRRDGAQVVVQDVLPYEFPHDLNVIIDRKLIGERRDDLTRSASVFAFFRTLDLIDERL